MSVDVCFTGPLLALIGPLALALSGAIGVLYRDGIKSRDQQIAYLTGELAAAHALLRAGIPVMDEAETQIRTRARGQR